MDPATLIEMAQTWLRLAQEEDPSRGSGGCPSAGFTKSREKRAELPRKFMQLSLQSYLAQIQVGRLKRG